jgi:molecular chaperone DnaK
MLRDVCGFDEEQIVLLDGGEADPRLLPTRANILREISRAPRMPYAAEDGLVILFYSGHGFRSEGASADYLLPRDAVMTALDDSALRFDRVVDYLHGWQAKHVVLFVDACRAAVAGGKAAADDDLARIDVAALCPPGVVTFCSCEPQRSSYEAEALQAGIFTAGVVEALSDEGKCKTIYELDAYLAEAVPRLSARFSKPQQRPYTRVEPLGVQRLEIVSAVKRNEWRAATPIGDEARRAAVPRSRTALAMSTDPLCAVDFGTSYSAIAVENGREFVPVPSAEGQALVPSVLNFRPDLTYTVGAAALEEDRLRPDGTIRHVKRTLASGEFFEFAGRSLPPELSASLILRSLRTNAEQFLDRRVTRCLAAYPANFGTAQRNSLDRAFRLAGFEVARMVGEPNAAALLVQQFLEQGLGLPREEGWGLVVDLGGGTFDVALVEYGDVRTQDAKSDLVVEVVAVGGSNQLGGLDYDEAIVDHLRRELGTRTGIGERTLAALESQLIREAERAKRTLGSRDETVVLVQDVPLLGPDLGDVEIQLDRARFRDLTAPLDQQVEATVHRVLSSPKARGRRVPERLDFILLAGQGSKVFTVREVLERRLPDVRVIREFQDTAVVRGLAHQTGILNGERKDLLLLDVLHEGLGIRCSKLDGTMPVVSRDPAENRRFLRIVEPGKVIPAARFERVTVAGEPARPLRLTVAEVTGLTEEAMEVAEIEVVTAAPRAVLDVAFDIDENRTIVLAVSERDGATMEPLEGGAAAAYQLTNPHLEAKDLIAEAVNDRHEWSTLPRVPITKLAAELI